MKIVKMENQDNLDKKTLEKTISDYFGYNFEPSNI